MFALLAAALAAAPFPDIYQENTTHVFAAVANDRVVDGLTYSDGSGVLSAGLLHARSSGLFVNMELTGLRGDGHLLPDSPIVLLETAAGWQWRANEHSVSLAVLDYRLHDDGNAFGSQGLSLDYRWRGLALEAGVERDKAYFYSAYPFDARTDIWRIGASWTGDLGDDTYWQFGGGTLELTPPGARQHYLAAGFGGEWRGFEWQLQLSGSEGDVAPDAEGPHLVLRIARAFRLK